MKSFFALAVAVALTVTPCAMAHPAPPGAAVRFFTNLRGDLAFGVTNGRPVPGAPLVVAEAGNGFDPADPTVFALTEGTNRAPGHIRLLGGFPDQPLCVSGRRVNDEPNRPAIVDPCSSEDPAQWWFAHGGHPTTISNDDRECITVRGDSTSPSVGDQVTIQPCGNWDGPEQLWNVLRVLL